MERMRTPQTLWAAQLCTPASLLPNNTEVLELLLNEGVDINSKAEGGKTAISDAAWMGNEINVKFLLSKVNHRIDRPAATLSDS